MALQRGEVIRDNDPRMPNRRLVIVEVHPSSDRVTAEDVMGRRFKIHRDRIYRDGKPRRNGFNLEPIV